MTADGSECHQRVRMRFQPREECGVADQRDLDRLGDAGNLVARLAA